MLITPAILYYTETYRPASERPSPSLAGRFVETLRETQRGCPALYLPFIWLLEALLARYGRPNDLVATSDENRNAGFHKDKCRNRKDRHFWEKYARRATLPVVWRGNMFARLFTKLAFPLKSGPF